MRPPTRKSRYRWVCKLTFLYSPSSPSSLLFPLMESYCKTGKSGHCKLYSILTLLPPSCYPVLHLVLAGPGEFLLFLVTMLRLLLTSYVYFTSTRDRVASILHDREMFAVLLSDVHHSMCLACDVCHTCELLTSSCQLVPCSS